VNAYRNNAFRPPSGSEIRTWAGPFTANPATTLPELNTSIVNAINANLGGTRASSITNSCGGPL
jgi:hypothetical protein